MRRRGVVFSDFKEVDVKGTEVEAAAVLNRNLKLIMELLADLRVNTSSDPKEGEDRRQER